MPDLVAAVIFPGIEYNGRYALGFEDFVAKVDEARFTASPWPVNPHRERQVRGCGYFVTKDLRMITETEFVTGRVRHRVVRQQRQGCPTPDSACLLYVSTSLLIYGSWPAVSRRFPDAADG